MADHRRWFKVWTSVLSDPDLLSLDLCDLGRWMLLGACIAEHGHNGIMVIPISFISKLLSFNSMEETIDGLKRLPNVIIEDKGQNTESVTINNRYIAIQFKNWHKYQIDWSGERVSKFREMKRSKKRREVDKNKPPIVPQGKLNMFELFWEKYPRKKSKGQAEKAWMKISPNEQLQGNILTALEQAKNSEEWVKEGGRFIPYPATWLNAKGWEDEYQQRKDAWKYC